MTKKFATVGELVEKLKKFDQDLPFGVIGHYGEFHEMDLLDVRQANTYVPNPSDSWYSHIAELVVVRFECPDIGEPPE